ncbi:MAG TPA: RNA polymerase subunit sigma-70, partial [Sulfitobacter sp.]|nr:RNA polymerase subunit sigma-70 [Sulfitobacter sp.]
MAGFAFKSTKTLRWALGLSLGVNLLVLGLVAGAVYRF